MKTIPFDLQKALAGAKIVARDGSEPEQWFYFDKAVKEGQQLACVFDGEILFYYDSGAQAIHINSKDLFLAVETVTKWIIVYKNANNQYIAECSIYDTEEEAKEHAGPDFQTIPIEVEL